MWQVIDIGWIGDMPMIYKRPDPFGTQRIYIHCPFGNKMFDPAQNLWRTSIGIGTEMLCFSSFSFQCCSTFRAMGDILNRFAVSPPFLKIYSCDFRDYFSSLLHRNSILNMQIQSYYFICIM